MIIMENTTSKTPIMIGIGVIIAVLIALGVWFLYTIISPKPESQYNPAQNSNTNIPEDNYQGTVFFSVTDAAMDAGVINNIDISIDKLELHSQSQGWITVLQTSDLFSLLDLKAKNQVVLLEKVNAIVDIYDKVRLRVAKVMVTESGYASEAKLPSNELTMNGTVKVLPNSSSSVEFDFLALESIHKTSKGEFIFVPVVKFESRSNATVQVDADNTVVASNGNVDDTMTLGMDINGEMKNNFRINTNVNLEINNGIIKIR